MSGLLSRWRLQSMCTTVTCLLLLGENLAQTSCQRGTTELQADSTHRLLSFPSNRSAMYPPDCERKWRIRASTGWVELFILGMDIEEAESCKYDGLTIDSETSYHDDNLCGEFQNRNISGLSSPILLTFYSDDTIEGKGFSLTYVSKQDEQEEVNSLIATYSNNDLMYPTMGTRYPNAADVRWRIAASNSNQKVTIYLITQDIENESTCSYDSLTIFDGYDSSAPVLKRLCGDLDLSDSMFSSTSQYLFLHFISDATSARGGFKLRYTTTKSESTCNNDLDAVTDLIASDEDRDLISPNYPALYPSDCRIQWRISSVRQRMRFDIVTLDIEGEQHCTYDSLIFYDGYDDSAKILKKLCGDYTSEADRIFFSNSDFVYVRFTSDTYREGGGFRIYYRAEEGNDDSSSNSAVIVGGIFGGVCLVILVGGLVAAVIRRTRNEQTRRRLQQQRNNMSSSANPSTSYGSQSPGIYVITPSAPPPPYASLNHAYVHEEPPPSYSEANLYITDSNPPPLYSAAILSQVTAGQTSPATLSGADVTAPYKEEEGDIHERIPAAGANGENLEASVYQVPNSDQEPQPDYELGANDEQPLPDHVSQDRNQDS